MVEKPSELCFTMISKHKNKLILIPYENEELISAYRIV